MSARRVAKILLGCTFTLLLIGGVVHTKGASLACPDWPLCFGQFFPPMRGGIRYEHGHRLVAGLVAALTAWLCALNWQTPGQRGFSLVGLVLVLVQASLGGLTVLLRLPPLVSVAHLGTSMIFFAWAVAAHERLAPTPARPSLANPSWRPVALAAAGTYLQLVLGALVRHRGASMACGHDVLACAGRALPADPLQWLQTSHRLGALVVTGLIIWSTLPPMRQARRAGRRDVWRVCLALHALVLAQLAVGVGVIKTTVQLHVVTTHLALGALLWGLLVLLDLRLRPASATVPAAATIAAPNRLAGELDGVC